MRKYDSGFLQFIEDCEQIWSSHPEDYLGYPLLVGSGNPDSRILFIGKEASTDAYDTNTINYYHDVLKGVREESKWTRLRSDEEAWAKQNGKPTPPYWKNPKQTVWGNYQRIIDIVYPEYQKDRSQCIDFENYAFCTELSVAYRPKSQTDDLNARLATESSLEARKRDFFRLPFFDRFDVIVIDAPGNYIANRPGRWEINDIFHVYCPNPDLHKDLKFWVHESTIKERPRILIQARNFSCGVEDELIPAIAAEIRKFLASQSH